MAHAKLAQHGLELTFAKVDQICVSIYVSMTIPFQSVHMHIQVAKEGRVKLLHQPG